MAPVVVLALDADSAGQGAMLNGGDGSPRTQPLELRVARAARRQRSRRPRAQRGGAGGATEALDGLGPVRALPRRAGARAGDAATPEGRDRIAR